jgi:hypothetical protein
MKKALKNLIFIFFLTFIDLKILLNVISLDAKKFLNKLRLHFHLFRISKWIEEHQLFIFFFFMFIISWGILGVILLIS